MPLLGRGVAAIWHNVAPSAQADYNHWHVHEHVPERVGIPGFLRGRRYGPIDADPEFFHFYETESLETLTSPAYLERLNSPTPWTRRVGPELKDNNRSLCRVEASFGIGLGAAILTGRFATTAGEPDPAAWLAREALPALIGTPGLVAAHLLRGDQEASHVQTEEKAMREGTDAVADSVFFVEAVGAGPLEELRAGTLSPAALEARGASEVALGTYRLHFTLSDRDLA